MSSDKTSNMESAPTTAEDDIVIRVEHISKCFEMYAKPRHRLQQMIFGRLKTYYKEFWALKDVSFTVKRGEAIGVIGKNGAGKSTLLQILVSTLCPTSGTVSLKGRVAALLELGSGFNPEFSGRENVYLNASILGVKKEEIELKFSEIEEFADIGEFIDQPVKNYSSGMMVRLAFAVQVMIKPDILIVDEALAVGDAAFQRKCYARMEELQKSGTTLFLVTHDTEAVNRMCSRCLFLKNGVLAMDGPSQPVIAEYMNYSFQQNVIDAKEVLGSTRYETLEENGIKILRITPKKADSKYGIGGGRVKQVMIYGMEKDNIIMTPAKIKIRVELEWDTEKVRAICKKEALPENISFGIGLRDRRNIMIFGDNTSLKGLNIPISNMGSATLNCFVDLPRLCKDKLFLHTSLWCGDAGSCLPLDYGTDLSFSISVHSKNEQWVQTGILDADTVFELL